MGANQRILAQFSSSQNICPRQNAFHEFKCSRNRAGFEMPRNICGIAAALLQNLHLIGAVNTEFKVEHRILPGIPILCPEQRNMVLG